MFKFRAGLAVAALLALTASVGPARAASTTIAYEPSTFAYSFCEPEPAPGAGVATGHNLGAVCPVVKPGDKVKITNIADVVNGNSVAATVLFMNKDFKAVGDVDLLTDPVGWLDDSCDTCTDACGPMSSALTAPATSKYFYVQFKDPAFAQADCGSLFATTGTITISIVTP